MLHHCDDNQRKVDEAIMTVDSTVAHFPSPQGRFCETVFTKLRNELSHKRDGVSMIDTHQKVRANVQRFEHIVKTYVLRMD
jgi:hypothetical protein